jgi:hypothetical protein
MAKSILISFTNTTSDERDAELNEWYDNVHSAEMTALDGIRNITRYRAVTQVIPPGTKPAYRYIAVYELDDMDRALQSLAKHSSSFSMSDAVDFGHASAVAFEQIFTTDPKRK